MTKLASEQLAELRRETLQLGARVIESI
ncbi:MAG: hypothetical protein RIS33_1516, partial [Actinomycetota bacterium]